MNARWMWIALVGALAFTQWALWRDAPRQLERELRPEVYGPAEDARAGALRQARETAFALEALRQVERFSREAADAREAGNALDVGPSDPPRAPLAEARARAALDAWGLDAPRVAVGLYLGDDFGWPASIARPPAARPAGRVVAGRLDDGRPFCLQLGRIPGPAREAADRTLSWATLDGSGSGPGSFGPCWLHARYGEPGPAVAEWMWSTGLGAAVSSHEEDVWTPEDPTELRLYRALGIRATSGLWGEHSALADHCIGGDGEACRALFLAPAFSPGGATVDAALPHSGTAGWTGANFLPGNWLHTLEAAYGPERMAAFWTSDADVVTAFEQAFDADLETAMMELGRTRYGHEPTGPRPGVWGWLGLAGALFAGAAAGTVVTARRSVA